MSTSSEFFSQVKDAKTTKHFFNIARKICRDRTYDLRPSMICIYMTIAEMCPDYKIVAGNSIVRDVIKTEGKKMTLAQEESFFSELKGMPELAKIYGYTFRKLTALYYVHYSSILAIEESIDLQAKVLGVSKIKYRASILPHLKLAIAYCEN